MKVQCRLFFVGFTERGTIFFDKRTEEHKSRLAHSQRVCSLRGGHPLRTFQNFVFLFFCQKMFKVFAVYCLWEDMQDFANL